MSSKVIHSKKLTVVGFFFSMNTNSVRRRPIRTEGSPPVSAQKDIVFAPTRSQRQRTSARSIDEDWLVPDEPVRHVKRDPIGCLVLSAGQDSIFDWLSSGHSELGVAAGFILP